MMTLTLKSLSLMALGGLFGFGLLWSQPVFAAESCAQLKGSCVFKGSACPAEKPIEAGDTDCLVGRCCVPIPVGLPESPPATPAEPVGADGCSAGTSCKAKSDCPLVQRTGYCKEGDTDNVCCKPAASASVKKCGEAPGGQCQSSGVACPNGKVDVEATYTCSAMGSKCCASVSAGAGNPGSSTKLKDPLGGVGLYGLLRRLISAVLGLVGAVALIVFFASGVMYMVGGEENVTKAKSAMASAAIGLAIIFFAYTITNFFFTALTTVPLK